jgi:uncharacterized protein (DUF58 family)
MRATTLEELLPAALASRLERLDVLSRKIFAGKLPGERRSKRRGSSVEFDDYRDYAAGDDLRHIDWNVVARLDRVFVKLFREDEDLALHVVVDASASMDAGTPSKIVLAQRLAMGLAYIGLSGQSRVMVSVMGAPKRAPVQTLAAVRGRRNTRRIAEFLLEASRAPEGESVGVGVGAGVFGEALKAISMRSRMGGRGVMVVLSDFLVEEEVKRGLGYIGEGHGYDVHAFMVLSPGELEPEKEAGGGVIGDVRLTDVETGRATEVSISGAVLRRYKARIAEHVEQVRGACLARGIGFAMVRSDADAGDVLLRVLRARGVIG